MFYFYIYKNYKITKFCHVVLSHLIFLFFFRRHTNFKTLKTCLQKGRNRPGTPPSPFWRHRKKQIDAIWVRIVLRLANHNILIFIMFFLSFFGFGNANVCHLDCSRSARFSLLFEHYSHKNFLDFVLHQLQFSCRIFTNSTICYTEIVSLARAQNFFWPLEDNCELAREATYPPPTLWRHVFNVLKFVCLLMQ